MEDGLICRERREKFKSDHTVLKSTKVTQEFTLSASSHVNTIFFVCFLLVKLIPIS